MAFDPRSKSIVPLLVRDVRTVLVCVHHLAHGLGNPNPGNLGTDFNRLGLAFWTDVLAAGVQNTRRRDLLEEMNTWRNAIAHHNFDPARLAGRTTLTLGKVRDWRSACRQLARTFDDVMKNHLQLVTGTVPW